MKRILLAVLPLTLCTSSVAQTWDADFVNQPSNIRHHSLSPTRLSENKLQNFASAKVSYHWQKGDFHAIDQSSNAHHLDAFIGGLRKIGKVNLSGHLRYQNQKDLNQCWNSTLWNNPDNPFLLCDSVPGDATTESFDMKAAASYPFNDRLRGGLELGLRTGSRADQTDPRPKTATSIIPITAGMDYQFNDAWSTGLSAGVKFFSSVIEYYNVQPTINYRYFLMKGMGDYLKRSTGDDSGYKRDYQGTTFQAALNAEWQARNSQWADFIEVSFATGNQNANDGGTSYSFYGGDYSEQVIGLHNRVQFKPTDNTHHNLTLNATLTNGKGTWYDQKRQTDMEHGNIIYYEVLSKSTNHKSQRLTASLAYQLDLLRNGQRDFYIYAQAGMNILSRKQLLGYDTPKQDIQTIDLSLQAGKVFHIKKVTLLTQLGGGYHLPGSCTFASGSTYTNEDDITTVYTRHVFEYETASAYRIHILADASMPVSSQLTAGLYAQAQFRGYTGNEEYWQGYKGKKQTQCEFGLYLKF